MNGSTLVEAMSILFVFQGDKMRKKGSSDGRDPGKFLVLTI